MDYLKQHGMMKNNSKRYYLHKKAKSLGAVIHSKKKTVELVDELFRNPSPLLKEYLYRLKKFNYSIQSVIMTAEKENSSTKAVALLPKETLIEKFRYVNSKIPVLEKTSLELKVESSEQLVIAENNASEVQGYIKEVEKIRKAIKAPYADTVKMIDSYCKAINDGLERIKMRFSSQITQFKIIQEAQAKIEAEKKIKEIESSSVEKQEEADRVKRIMKQLYARLYGGTYTTKAGTVMPIGGCIKSDDIGVFVSWFNENAPKLETFKYFATVYEDSLMDFNKSIARHKVNLLEVENGSPEERTKALEDITIDRLKAESDQLLLEGLLGRTIIREQKKEIKSAESEVTEAGKGVRETIKYDVTEDILVPRDFLSVDTVKINAYLNDNREKIKQDIADNKEIIPGIRFYVDSKFVAR